MTDFSAMIEIMGSIKMVDMLLGHDQFYMGSL